VGYFSNHFVFDNGHIGIPATRCYWHVVYSELAYQRR
jgi:hypothetical protein